MSPSTTTTTSSRLPRLDGSPLPGITDLLSIITYRATTVRGICDGEDVLAPQSHAKRTRSTVCTVVGPDIGAISGIFQRQVPGVTALTVNITSVEEFLAKVGASDGLILGCAVTDSSRWRLGQRRLVHLLSAHFLEVHCKQLTSMAAFLKLITSDTLKPAPNTITHNHAA